MSKPFLKYFLVGAGLGLLALLFGAARRSGPAPGENDALQSSPPRESTTPSKPDLNEQAAKLVEAGDYKEAIRIYAKLLVEKPKSVNTTLKLAGCLLMDGQKAQARQLLLELARDENLPLPVRGQLFDLLLQATVPQLSSATAKTFEDALNHIRAGEVLANSSHDEYEARPERKRHYPNYARAIELLDRVLAEAPTYFPAYLFLGLAHENVSSYHKAAEAYATYLRHCEQSGLPRCERTSEVETRRLVSEQRARADADLAKRVVGAWQGYYAWPGTVFPESPSFSLVLLDGGTVQGQGGRCHWRVVDGYLIVCGLIGTSNEWCHAGRLRTTGLSVEGFTLGAHEPQRVMYRKK
jgi:tetratricopeptide (TPR) repeat protein